MVIRREQRVQKVNVRQRNNPKHNYYVKASLTSRSNLVEVRETGKTTESYFFLNRLQN